MDPLILIHQPAPDFILPDLEGKPHALSEYRGQVVVLNFWSAECPWSARTDAKLRRCLDGWEADIALLTIASNANEPPARLRQVAAEQGLPIVLHDAGQEVANRYGARTTPHLFVIDPLGVVRYQGAFDDVTFRQRRPTRDYLCQAVEAVQTGRQPDPDQTPPYGCALVRHTP